jgi:hypothetical protein
VRPVTRLFIGAVIAAGTSVLFARMPLEFARPALALVFLATMLSVSLFKLRLPLGLGQSTMSMAYIVDFTALVTLGADVAMLIAAAGVVAQCTLNVRRPQPWYRTAFSTAAIVLSVQAAGWMWALLGGSTGQQNILASLAPLAGAAVVYFAINTGLIAGGIGMANSVPVTQFWQRNFMGTLPAYLLAAAVASTLVTFRDAYVLLGVALAPMALGHLLYGAWFRQVARQSAPVVSQSASVS